MRQLKICTLSCFGLVIATLGATSLLDAVTGREGLTEAVYGSRAFAAMWALLALLSTACLACCAIWRRPATALLHAALLIILLGGLATRLFGERGTLHIRQERPLDLFMTADGDFIDLPFDVQLDSFYVSFYPNSNAPRDYFTRVKISDGGKRFAGTASMNRPLAHRNYRFYQADYDADLGGSTLLVAHDPLGVGVTYAGYALLLIAVIGYIAGGGGRFRELLKRESIASAARKERGKGTPARMVCLVVAAAAWVALSVVIARQAVALHRVPLADGVEAMRALAWVSLVLALALHRRNALILPAGIAAAALAMLTAALTGGGVSSEPLMPVLRSPLLAVHVAVIIAAYALLLFVFFICAIALTRSLFRRTDVATIRRLRRTGETMLFPALFLLMIGIFLGAIWANISWGRYWGWDAKETWALITMMVYALPLHSRRLAWFASDRRFCLYCAAAFPVVLMTYFGANYFLAGLHSYA